MPMPMMTALRMCCPSCPFGKRTVTGAPRRASPEGRLSKHRATANKRLWPHWASRVTVVYFLVLLQDNDGSTDVPDHESFIDSLIRQNAVLLGGAFEDAPLPGISGAYLLHCASLAEAHAHVAADPVVVSGAARPIVTRWNLVGVNTAAIEQDLVIGPTDV